MCCLFTPEVELREYFFSLVRKRSWFCNCVLSETKIKIDATKMTVITAFLHYLAFKSNLGSNAKLISRNSSGSFPCSREIIGRTIMASEVTFLRRLWSGCLIRMSWLFTTKKKERLPETWHDNGDNCISRQSQATFLRESDKNWRKHPQ